MAVKALACELPSRLGVPLSRLHVPDITSEVLARGIVAEISGTTIWRVQTGCDLIVVDPLGRHQQGFPAARQARRDGLSGLVMATL